MDETTLSYQQEKHLPPVLIHRPPSLNLPFRQILESHFHLLDPLDSPDGSTGKFLVNNGPTVRALLCIDPCPISSDLLCLLPSLELIVGSTAGVDHIDLTECRRRGIRVTSAGSVFSVDVADYAVGLLIDVLRRISAADRCLRGGLGPVKEDYPLGFKLGGKRIGIVGLGGIGTEVANRLVPFGCSIAYCSRKNKPSVTFPYHANIRDLAIKSDILILTCALTVKTHHIVDKDVMTALGKGGVIINVGRGALVDEKELVRFLVQGELAGAGFDVYENEPDVPAELLVLDNVVLSPHVAAVTTEGFDGVAELIMYNLMAFFSNQPLQSVVEFE